MDNSRFKFRAWDKATQKMMPVSILGISEGFITEFSRKMYHNSMQWDGEDGFSSDYILMQFTGLHDKNGKEIYEGDIVEYIQHKGYGLKSGNMIVEWMDEDACFGWKYVIDPFLNFENLCEPFAETHDLKSDLLNHLEVIGNMYENPELK